MNIIQTGIRVTRYYFVIISLSIFLLGCSPEQKNTGGVFEQEKADGWQLLFDGKTTKGWHNYNEKGVNSGWIAKNGELVALGKGGDIGGDIITDKEFTNFDFKIEWKISHGGNSGIFRHGIESDKYPSIYFTAPEYQLIDDIGFPHNLKEWQSAGADYAMYNADKSKKKLKMVGEWNSSRIVVEDSLVQHYLNGEKIVEFKRWTDDWKKLKTEGKWAKYPDHGLMKTGKMGLQDHGSKMWFRNIKIKEL